MIGVYPWVTLSPYAMKELSIQIPFDRSRLIARVRALSSGTGPRGTGIAEEAQAPAYVHSRLQTLEVRNPEEQRFRAVTSQKYFPPAVGVLALLAVLFSPPIPPFPDGSLQ